MNNIITYKKILKDKHSVNAVGGFSYQSWTSAQSSVTNMNFPSNALTYYNKASAASPGRTYNTDQSRALASVISRLNYALLFPVPSTEILQNQNFGSQNPGR